MAQLLTYFDTYTTDSRGGISLTGIVDIKEYSKIHMMIFQYPAVDSTFTAGITMGKLSGTTLGQSIDTFPVATSSPKILEYPVIGPELSVRLYNGPKNTPVSIQAWILLH